MFRHADQTISSLLIVEPCASTHLSVLPKGIVVEPSSYEAWLLITISIRLRLPRQFTRFILRKDVYAVTKTSIVLTRVLLPPKSRSRPEADAKPAMSRLSAGLIISTEGSEPFV